MTTRYRHVLSLTAALLAAVSLAGACAQSGRSVEVALLERDGSGVTGTVKVTSLADDRSSVAVSVVSPASASFPVHVHAGWCGDLTPQPLYPLDDVQGGRSETEVAVSLQELEAVPLAVNVHRSTEDWTAVACADLPGAAAAARGSKSSPGPAHQHGGSPAPSAGD